MGRVVITGMGIYSCIGKNLDEVKEWFKKKEDWVENNYILSLDLSPNIKLYKNIANRETINIAMNLINELASEELENMTI